MKTLTPANTLLRTILASLALLLIALALPAQSQLAYDNDTTFLASGSRNLGAVGDTGVRQTNLVADDLTYDPAFSLRNVTQIRFSLANFNATMETLVSSVRFYNSDGAGGGPGTLFAAFNFGGVPLASNNVTLLTFNIPLAQQFVLPTSGTIWAGVFFSSSTQTAAVLNNFGQGLYNPPTVGSSQDRIFASSDTPPGTFGTNNPAGSIVNDPFGTGPVGNFGWSITVAPIPEPSSIAMAFGGLGMLFAVQRLRRKR